MPDQRPPWLAVDERETLTDLLQFQRDSMVRKVEGIDDEQARRSPVPSGTSLLWLVKHLTFAELIWVEQRFAGRTDVVLDGDVRPDDAIAAAVAAYRTASDHVDAVVAGSALDDPCRGIDAPPVNLRWVLAHLLEETARHAGHADILRELIDGQTGR